MANSGAIRPGTWLSLAAAIVILLVIVAVYQGTPTSESEEPTANRAAAAAKDRAPNRLQKKNLAEPESLRRLLQPETGDDPEMSGSDYQTEGMETMWEAVDLEEVRTAMPDNLYWKVAAPSQDEKVLEERRAESDRWNVEYGKILSGSGSEEEIRAYFDHRARLSGDYVEFTTYLLDRYRNELPERDVALLELARRLHLARLEEIPRKIEEAFERKRQQDEARRAWLEQEAEFRSSGD